MKPDNPSRAVSRSNISHRHFDGVVKTYDSCWYMSLMVFFARTYMIWFIAGALLHKARSLTRT
jgi:hypothetical protein